MRACCNSSSNKSRRGVHRWAPLGLLLFVAAICLLPSLSARGEVFHSRESALAVGFAGADSISTRTITLSSAQADEAARLAGAKLPSRLIQVYEAWQNGSVAARGIIDTHKVRSLPETLLIVIDVQQRVRAVHLLAFHEPVQYRAPEKWFSQFEQRALDPELAVRRGVSGIAGATMTSNAVTAAVRRALATLRIATEDDIQIQAQGADSMARSGK